MAAICEIGTAERIAKWLGPKERRRLAVDSQCRAPFGVDRSAALRRQTIEDFLYVALDVGECLGLQHTFENVETTAPIGVENVGMKLARSREADRSPIAEGKGSLLALAQIGLHRRFLGAVGHGSGRVRPVHVFLPWK